MGKFRNVHLLGVGMLTPALTGYPQAAGARSVDVTPAVHSAENDATAKGRLQRALFALSPAEKLKIAADRIRLSQTNPPSPKMQSSAELRCCPQTAKSKPANVYTGTCNVPTSNACRGVKTPAAKTPPSPQATALCQTR